MSMRGPFANVRQLRAAALALALTGVLSIVSISAAPPASAGPAAPAPDWAALVTVPGSDVVLAWNAVAGASSYKVTVSASPTMTPALYSATTTGLRATPVTPLPAGTIYWQVVATGTDGAGEPLLESFVWEPTAGPVLIKPTGGAVVGYPEPTVLSWQPVPGATSYTVDLSTSASFPSGSTLTPDTAATSFTVPTLLARDVTWNWRVRATLKGGLTTAYSDTGTFQVAWTNPAPELLSPPDSRLPGAVPVSDVVLDWSPVAGASKYRVYVASDPDFTNPAAGTPFTVAGTSYTPPRTWDNAPYYWRVSAIDAAGNEGPPSVVKQFRRLWGPTASTTMEPGEEIAAPLISAAASSGVVSRDDLVLAWTPVPRAAAYEVLLTSEAGNFFTNSDLILKCYTTHTSLRVYDASAGLSSSGNLKFTDTCMANFGDEAWTIDPEGTTFRWRVRALDLAGNDVATHTTTQNVDALPRYIRSAWSDRYTAADPASVTVMPSTATAPGLKPELTGPADCLDVSTCEELPDTPELTWEPVAGATAGYWVQIALDRDFSNKVAEFHTTTAGFRPNGGLLDNTANQAYYWRVMGCSSFSTLSVKSCLPDGAANIRAFRKLGPTVEDLAVTHTGDEIAFSWSPVESPGGIRGYEVQVATTPLFSGTVKSTVVDQPFASTQALAGTANQLALLQDGTYYWRVRAIDGVAAPLPWTVAQETFVKSSPLSTHAVGGPPAASAPALVWSAVPGTASYEVEVYTGGNLSAGGARVSAASKPGLLNTAYAPTAHLAAGQYSWRVRRVDGSGNALGWSAEVNGAVPTFTVAAPKVVATAPASGAVLGPKDRLLTWAPSPGASAYKVEVSTSLSFTTTAELVASTTQTSYALTGASLVRGTTYHWRVTPLGTNGQTLGDPSAPRAFTVDSSPGAPTSVRVADITATSASVSWTAPAGSPTKYFVSVLPNGGTEWTTVSTTGTAVSLTGLMPGTVYAIRVSAENAVGVGPFGTSTVTTKGVPSEPLITKVESGDRRATVTWSAPTSTGGSSITGYTIVASPGGASVPASASARSAVVTGLVNGRSYTFVVTASNAYGAGLPSAASTPVGLLFTDVPADHTFAADIAWLADRGITTGMGDGSFGAALPVTRQAMAAFLYRYEGSPVQGPVTQSFTDVPPETQFFQEIEWLYARGVTTGSVTPDGRIYQPADPVSRQAMAAFLYRNAGKPEFEAPTVSPFVDVPVDNPFYREIAWLAAMGISTGSPAPGGGVEFKPADPVTRQAMAAFLHRYSQLP